MYKNAETTIIVHVFMGCLQTPFKWKNLILINFKGSQSSLKLDTEMIRISVRIKIKIFQRNF